MRAARTRGARRLVVVGDVMLDRDVAGHVDRVCPDAPAPVLSLDGRSARPGGAALAAWLAARAGVSTALVASLGDDGAAADLRRLLGQAGVEVLDLGGSGSSVVKTRFRAGGQTLLRLDEGPIRTTAASVVVGDDVGAVVHDAAAVLVSDYGGGITASAAVRALLGVRARRAPVVWDPHPRGTEPVPGVHLVTPNAAEAAGWAGGEGRPPTVHARRARVLRDRWQARAVSVTCGERGAVLVEGHGAPLVVPAEPIVASDTCGAGDAFAVHAARALVDGALVSEAVVEAVAAAGSFVAGGGAAAVAGHAPGRSRGVASAPRSSPPPVAAPRGARPRVVAAGGCFDVLHAGHVRFLRDAAALGDRLVVLLNSDASVRRLKGPGRPVNHQADRAAVLAALDVVDEVRVFDEDTPEAALDRLRPDLFVKGGDYAGQDLPEAEVTARWGGDVVVVPYLAGRSTTNVLEASHVR